MSDPRHASAPGRETEGEAKNLVGTGSTASLLATTDPVLDDTVTRCRICRHELHAERSRRLHLGPVCRRRISTGLVLPGWRVADVAAAEHGVVVVVLMPVVDA